MGFLLDLVGEAECPVGGVVAGSISRPVTTRLQQGFSELQGG
jgi:hypothetical protein